MFQVDGFRFDLMGHIMKRTMVSIDSKTWLTTLESGICACKQKVNDTIFLLGKSKGGT